MKKLAVFLVGVIFGFASIFLNYSNFVNFYYSLVVCAATAFIFGYIASKWTWVRNNNSPLISGTCFGGFVALLPLILASYGLGLVILFPFMFLWSVCVLVGVKLQNRSFAAK